jgi:hypothetical protein
VRDALQQIVEGYRRQPAAVPPVPGSGTDEAGVPAAAAAELAELDSGAAGPMAALQAQLSVTLGQLGTAVDQWRTERRRYLADPYAVAWAIPLTSVLQLSGAGAGIVDLGGPKQGYMWRVRRVSISDAQSFTASMGAAVGQFYEGIPSDAANSATMRPQLVIWPFASLPNAATFGADEVPLIYPEHLVAVVTGGSANQQLQVSARYQIMSVASQRPAIETV